MSAAFGSRGTPYDDRVAAGDALAGQLTHYAGRNDVVVLGLPRGGVPVAARVADALRAPLDVLVVRKLGLPRQPELAMGAIAGVDGDIEVVRNARVIARAGVDDATFAAALEAETRVLRSRERRYRGDRPACPVADRTVLVVDDGLATGATMRAAVTALRQRGPARIVAAVPIAAATVRDALRGETDEVVCPWTPAGFSAVGEGYRDFRAITDEEVQDLLSAAR